MYRAFHRIADLIARSLAMAGGAVLITIVVLTVISIIGRIMVPLQIGIGPIRGIYDITQMGIAAAVFAFLPLCQLNRGHAAVDLFEPIYPAVMNRFLEFLFDVVMLIAAVIGTYRLYLGMVDKRSVGQVSQIAEIPVWWGYAAGLVGAVGFVIVAVFCVLRSGGVLIGRKEASSV